MEALGYGALWSSGGFEAGFPARFSRLLDATDHVTVASGIISIWHVTPAQVAEGADALETADPGGSSSAWVSATLPSSPSWAPTTPAPTPGWSGYLDQLDGQGRAVASDRRVLAALGPRMLTLAAERAAGAHPYFVPVEHLARARSLVGPEPLLATELAVVLEADPEAARATARGYTTGYLGLPNYVENLRTLGFDDDDVEGGGSDRLVDAVVAWGDPAAIAERVRQFHDAGADHVCLQVVVDRAAGFPLGAYREIRSALPGR